MTERPPSDLPDLSEGRLLHRRGHPAVGARARPGRPRPSRRRRHAAERDMGGALCGGPGLVHARDLMRGAWIRARRGAGPADPRPAVRSCTPQGTRPHADPARRARWAPGRCWSSTGASASRSTANPPRRLHEPAHLTRSSPSANPSSAGWFPPGYRREDLGDLLGHRRRALPPRRGRGARASELGLAADDVVSRRWASGRGAAARRAGRHARVASGPARAAALRRRAAAAHRGDRRAARRARPRGQGAGHRPSQ